MNQKQYTNGIDQMTRRRTNLSHPSTSSNANNFRRFHKENPGVMELLISMAIDLKNNGRKRYSIRALMHDLRWQTSIKTRDDFSNLKINNNYSRFYAIEIMRVRPELKGFFEIREKNIH